MRSILITRNISYEAFSSETDWRGLNFMKLSHSKTHLGGGFEP